MEYLQNDNSHTSDASDTSLCDGAEDSLCNQEILTQQRTVRKSCFKERDTKKPQSYHDKHQNIELQERRINVGVRQTKLPGHPTVVEHKIKYVKDSRLRMTLPPTIESTTKNVETVYFGDGREGGDMVRVEQCELIPQSADVRVPRKRELHRLMHHRICNNVNPDIVIVIEDKEFFCHRMVLQSYSKYFDEINNLSHDEKVIVIDEPGVSKAAFTAIYSWMLSINHSGLKFVTKENFVEVLVASQILQIRDLEEQCMALLDSTEVFNEGYAYLLYKKASVHGQRGIKELMVPRIQHFFLPMVSTADFLDLSLEDVCTFLSSSYIVVPSELVVFHTGARWLLADWTSRKQHIPRVMACVRFGLMNPLELVDIRKNPKPPEIQKITEDPAIQKMIDDGLAYSTYCTMKGSKDDLLKQCEIFGLEIPQPRNWSENPKAPFLIMESNFVKADSRNLPEVDAIMVGGFFKNNPFMPLSLEMSAYYINASTIFRSASRLSLLKIPLLSSSGTYNKQQYYKTYDEFLSYLHYIRDAPHKALDGSLPAYGSPASAAAASPSCESQLYDFEISAPLHSFNDGIPSMSNLLSIGLRNKAMRDKKRFRNKKPYKTDSSSNKEYLVEEPPTAKNFEGTKSRRGGDTLRDKAATVIQTAWRGFAVRRRRRGFRIKSPIKQHHPSPSLKLEKAFSPEPPALDGPLKRSASDISLVPTKSCQTTPGMFCLNGSSAILVLGGINPQQKLSASNDGRSILRYFPEGKKWEKVGCLPRGRFYHSSAFLRGRVFVIGGVDPRREEAGQSSVCSDVWSLSPLSSDWTRETSLKTPRKNFGLVAFLGHLYVIGGQGPNDVILSSVEKYDPVQRVWEEVSPLPEPRLSPAVAKFAGSLWVAGGMSGTGKMLTQVHAYDYRQNKWVSKTSLRSGRGLSRLVAGEGRLYLVGGAEKDSERGCSISSTSIDVLESSCKEGRWEPWQEMEIPRHSHSSLLLDNYLYVIGGTTTHPIKNLTNVEVWSLDSKELKKEEPCLPAVLTGHASVLLPPSSQIIR